MNHCYKCQRELPEGQVECQPICEEPTYSPVFSDDEHDRMEREYLESTAPIDWDKVKTVEDVILILKHSPLVEDRVDRDSPAFEILKRFLKTEPDRQTE